MGHTITERILARAACLASVRPGDEIRATPSRLLAYDFPGTTDLFFRQMKQDFGREKVVKPQRVALFIDHMVPARQPKEEVLHQQTRAWAAEQGTVLHERKGIGHQVAVEEGYAKPGDFVLHHDGHVSQLGAYGTLAIGVRRNLIEAFISDQVTIKVPATTRVNVRGALQQGVMARDVFHHILRVLGPGSCNFQVVEFTGPTIEQMSFDGLQTLTGLTMFLGATSSIVNPNERTIAYARERTTEGFEPLRSDSDAQYAAEFDIDVSSLEPTVAIPPTPDLIRDLRDYLGLEVHSGYLGSCASGRLEDLEVAAKVLKGRTVKAGFALHVVPTSQRVLSEASRLGYVETLVDAGAFLSSPSCDYCYGHVATMAPGQRAVSTGTLNVPGRMGSTDSEIYLTNAAVVAASAIEGKIADPRRYLA